MSLKVPHKKKSKSKSSEKFDDSLLDEPTPSKASQSTPSTPDSSLQDMIKAMNNQLASLASQFEEFKRSDKPTSSQRAFLPLRSRVCVPLPPRRDLSHQKGSCRMKILPYLLGNDTDLGLLKVRQIHINRSWIPPM